MTDRARRAEFAACLVLTAGFVVLRSVPMVWHEQNFDSDQAIVGLMAKHLSEFRWFPLFFYGQHYLLGVQAWMAAPFFWLGGPTIAMLRAPLLVLNVAAPILLIVAMTRRGIRPVAALAASSPLIATTPVISAALLATLGASVEPCVYVIGLWMLRRRPLAFGLLACFGTLHREFTIFALPALAIAGRREWRAWGVRGFAAAGGDAVGLWVLIDVLKRQIGTFGPGAETPETGSLALQAATIAQWISLDWARYAGCLRDAIAVGLPDLFGASPRPLAHYAVASALSQGSVLAGLALAAALAVCIARLAWAARSTHGRSAPDTRFFLYLGVVALCPVVAYGLNGGLLPGDKVVVRYLLLSLLGPAAFFGWYFARETSRAWLVAAGVLIAVWAGSNVLDGMRFVHEYRTAPPPSHHRVMANHLMARGVTHGRAIYWDAYRITFLSQERVILASEDVVRIAAYQTAVEAHAARAVTLVREPCDAGMRIDVWCVTGGPPGLQPR